MLIAGSGIWVERIAYIVEREGIPDCRNPCQCLGLGTMYRYSLNTVYRRQALRELLPQENLLWGR